MKDEWDESYRGGSRATKFMRGGRLNYRNSFKYVNKKVPALFSDLNNPLFNIDKRNAAVGDLYEDIDQVVPLRWKFMAAVICPSGEILFSSMQPQGNISQGKFQTGYYEQVFKVCTESCPYKDSFCISSQLQSRRACADSPQSLH